MKRPHLIVTAQFDTPPVSPAGSRWLGVSIGPVSLARGRSFFVLIDSIEQLGKQTPMAIASTFPIPRVLTPPDATNTAREIITEPA